MALPSIVQSELLSESLRTAWGNFVLLMGVLPGYFLDQLH